MGADLVLASLPAVELSKGRSRKLHRLADRWSEDKLREWAESLCLDAEAIAEARESLHGHIDALVHFASRRDVVTLRLADCAFPLWFSGGMTWGDSPTEAYDTFVALDAAGPIHDQLRAWALRDAARSKLASCAASPAAAEQESTALKLLREFVEDIRTVYGGHDDKPDALDDERLDWPDLAATYRKALALLRPATPHNSTQENDH